MEDRTEHMPVLAAELAGHVVLARDAVAVDATVGHGGHSFLLGGQLGAAGTIIGLDVDEKSLERSRERLAGLECRVELARENFARLGERLEKMGVGKVDLILADLGFSSAQMADVERGLSFQTNMPLDMRLDDRLERTAADIVNGTRESDLADLIFRYGEERASRRIARFIAEQRRQRKILGTAELAELVCRAMGQRPGFGRIHPATRTFQALRIAVNDELGSLERLLAQGPGLLREGGYMAVISFHSLEDRLVKNDFRQRKEDGMYEILTKKPLTAGDDEKRRNPRSRSAKLRIARKTKGIGVLR